ncbi:hypothetical protein [uncultured Microbulbifer sp.]|uniref:hypothetical protein n=1 Tax=uncultured Microbulbifer sp. TaxID=348147 RepID=UPI002624CED8|nr:hypothetical protein [uncultured Microbulbifer sp.]
MIRTFNTKIKLTLLAPPLFSLLIVFSTATALAQSATLKKCQSWNDKIESYQEKRKEGGSGKEMDRWKRKIRQHRDKFRKNKCNRYGRKLN